MINQNFGRRQWIKLWVDPWLSGTTRFTLDHKQRAVWADVMALGGRSRIPGIICAGEEGGKIIGLPLSRIAGDVDIPDLNELTAIMTLFAEQDRISVEHESGRVIIHILNWSKYQAEYARQNRYKTKKKKEMQQATSQATPQATPQATGSATEKLHPTEGEVEGEVEGEGEGEGEEKTAPAPAAPSPSIFTGQYLSVTQKQDASLGAAFPWVNRTSEYLKADAWLGTAGGRRKNQARFIHNWFTRIPNPATPKEEKARPFLPPMPPLPCK